MDAVTLPDPRALARGLAASSTCGAVAGLFTRRGRVILAMALVGLVGLVGCTAEVTDGGHSTSPPDDRVPATEASAGRAGADGPRTSTPGLPDAPAGTGWSVVRVVDGDTLVVTDGAAETTVRLIGINTPEAGECLADEATAALIELVANGDVSLAADVSDRDSFGRALRYVETAAGLDAGRELVERGLAIERRYEPDVARSATYRAAQESARTAGRGMWAADACGEPDVTAAIEIDVFADPPGDDTKDLNSEWVRFTNASSEAIDLDGWQVADESASHRYTFDELLVPPGQSVTLHSGCGADTATVRYWCNTGSAIWNNSGDTVFLRDANGNLVAHLGYGDSAAP